MLAPTTTILMRKQTMPNGLIWQYTVADKCNNPDNAELCTATQAKIKEQMAYCSISSTWPSCVSPADATCSLMTIKRAAIRSNMNDLDRNNVIMKRMFRLEPCLRLEPIRQSSCI